MVEGNKRFALDFQQKVCVCVFLSIKNCWICNHFIDPRGMSWTSTIHDCITQALSAAATGAVCTCIKVEPSRKEKKKNKKTCPDITRRYMEMGEKVIKWVRKPRVLVSFPPPLLFWSCMLMEIYIYHLARLRSDWKIPTGCIYCGVQRKSKNFTPHQKLVLGLPWWCSG